MKTKEEIDELLEKYRSRLKALEQEYQTAQGAIAALEWAKQDMKEATTNETEKPIKG